MTGLIVILNDCQRFGIKENPVFPMIPGEIDYYRDVKKEGERPYMACVLIPTTVPGQSK